MDKGSGKIPDPDPGDPKTMATPSYICIFSTKYCEAVVVKVEAGCKQKSKQSKK